MIQPTIIDVEASGFGRGRPAREVGRELNARLRGVAVYCDAWAYDYAWLGRLYDAADLVPAFHLKDIRELLGECEQTLWHAARAAVELRLQLRRHRAGVRQIHWPLHQGGMLRGSQAHQGRL